VLLATRPVDQPVGPPPGAFCVSPLTSASSSGKGRVPEQSEDEGGQVAKHSEVGEASGLARRTSHRFQVSSSESQQPETQDPEPATWNLRSVAPRRKPEGGSRTPLRGLRSPSR
jgi:hypothetical protein